jgi:predicted lipid-binding transport protein (Tim44 family)
MSATLRNTIRVTTAAALSVALVVGGAEARPGGGKSFGSRGSSTYSAPPSTATAPRTTQPMQRSEASPASPARPTAPATQPRRFGLGTGIMAGLLGAGLFGMLMGNGFMGGLAGLASMLGLLLQVALIAGVAFLVIRFFRRRAEPNLATAGGPPIHARSALGPQPFGSRGGGAGPVRQPVEITPDDYRAFERNLGEVQLSYGRGDIGALRRLSTPEMARYLEEDLADDRRRGIRNEVSEPKLLQGDLAEAWREGTAEYATVAMRYQIRDVYLDAATGRPAPGSTPELAEVTEVWTFRRDMRGPWLLSAIQQTG